MLILNLSKNYESPIKAFLAYCKENGLKPDPIAFRQAAEAKYHAVKLGKLSGATYNLFISACRQFVLRSMELKNRSNIAFHAAQKMMKVKAIRVQSRINSDGVLSLSEIKILQKYATPRARLLIQVLQTTGLRISEALSLTADMTIQKDFVQATILAKGGKARTVYLALPLFREIQREFKGTNHLFETRSGGLINRSDAFKMIKAAATAAIKAGKADASILRKAHPHCFRHSFATEALKKNRDIYLVSRLLSHSSISTTARFYVEREILPEDYLNVYAS